MSDMEPIFLILDKIYDMVEYLCNYYNPPMKRNANIELGNLYTIKEEEEEEELF